MQYAVDSARLSIATSTGDVLSFDPVNGVVVSHTLSVVIVSDRSCWHLMPRNFGNSMVSWIPRNLSE